MEFRILEAAGKPQGRNGGKWLQVVLRRGWLNSSYTQDSGDSKSREETQEERGRGGLSKAVYQRSEKRHLRNSLQDSRGSCWWCSIQ